MVFPVKITDVNNLLPRYPFHFLFSIDFEHNLTARFSSCLRGSFFTKNVNAFERSSPNCAILTSLFSQPFADSLNQNIPNIPKWLIKEKPQSESANVVRKQWADLSRKINADISPVHSWCIHFSVVFVMQAMSATRVPPLPDLSRKIEETSARRVLRVPTPTPTN